MVADHPARLEFGGCTGIVKLLALGRNLPIGLDFANYTGAILAQLTASQVCKV